MRRVKLLALILPWLFMPWAVQAQSTVLDNEKDQQEVQPDASVKVMVIPFHEVKYYFSDCDKQVAEKSQLNVQDVRKSFQKGFDFAAEAKIEKKYTPQNLLQYKDSASVRMMDEYFNSVSYAYDKPTTGAVKKTGKFFKKIGKSISEATGKEEGTDLGEADSYTVVEATGEEEYMRVHFKDENYLRDLYNMYQFDYVVTINQFEIKTDYEKCIDREHGKYTRRIKVHYNIFSATGELIHGEVITAKYDSRSDDINEIIQDNFGFLAEYITKSLP